MEEKYTDDRPELFTDSQSLIDRNRKILWFICAMALLQIPIILMNTSDRDYSDRILVSVVVLMIYVPLVLLLLYGIIRLFIANAELKKKIRR